MRKVFLAAMAIAALLFATPSFSMNLEKEAPSALVTVADLCVTKSGFIKNHKDSISELYELPKVFVPEFEATINANKVSSGGSAIKIGGLIVGILKTGQIGIAYYDDKECIYANSVMAISPAQYDIIQKQVPSMKKVVQVSDGL